MLFSIQGCAVTCEQSVKPEIVVCREGKPCEPICANCPPVFYLTGVSYKIVCNTP